MDNKQEKKEIQNLIDKIDTVMFGKPCTKLTKLKDKKIDPLLMATGALLGLQLSESMLHSALPNANVDQVIGNAIIGASIGSGIMYLVQYFCRKFESNSYDNYEVQYLRLSREKQLKVLKLSKELVDYYKKDIENEKNKKYVEKYLNLDNDNTKFDNYDKKHPHFEILTQEQIDDIHARGKITPVEKYYEWVNMGYCPASGGSSVRCNKYGNCRDCQVAWAEEGKEWEPIKFRATDIFDRIFEEKKQKVKN